MSIETQPVLLQHAHQCNMHLRLSSLPEMHPMCPEITESAVLCTPVCTKQPCSVPRRHVTSIKLHLQAHVARKFAHVQIKSALHHIHACSVQKCQELPLMLLCACLAAQVIDRLDDYLGSAGSGCHVVLVPSTRDVHHHPVFPQTPLPPETVPTRHPQQFTLLRNPGTFACNEVEVGVVTSDVVKHLSGQEMQRGPQGDRLPSFAAHLLGQQRYDTTSGVNINIS